jgi:hypothetical protein
MKHWLTIGLYLAFHITFAQKIIISGNVLDNDTRELLPYASVGIAGKSIGTITNLDGAFDFYLPQEYRNEILVISMLGYTNFEAPIWSLLAMETLVIEMNKSTTVLDEVIIAGVYTGGDILQLALNRIDENYPTEPFMLEGFYRDIKKVANNNIALLEAAIKIYDEDYAAPRNKLKLRERVKLVEVRKSIGYDNRFTQYFHEGNFLENLLLQNNIRYRQIEMEEEHYTRINRLNDSYYNNSEIYVIEFRNGYLLRLYIDKNNFSIIHLDYEIGNTGKIEERKKKLISRFSGMTKSIDFRLVDGKMYPGYMSMSTRTSWYDAKTNELKFETELIQQLLINEITPNTSDRISASEKMRSYSLQYQDRPYNKIFWDNYNVIKDTPLDKKILEDLEKAGPLQKQFENGSLLK